MGLAGLWQGCGAASCACSPPCPDLRSVASETLEAPDDRGRWHAVNSRVVSCICGARVVRAMSLFRSRARVALCAQFVQVDECSRKRRTGWMQWFLQFPSDTACCRARDEQDVDSNETRVFTFDEMLARVAVGRWAFEKVKNGADHAQASRTETNPRPPPCDGAVTLCGFNLHASVRIAVDDDRGRERLFRDGRGLASATLTWPLGRRSRYEFPSKLCRCRP